MSSLVDSPAPPVAGVAEPLDAGVPDRVLRLGVDRVGLRGDNRARSTRRAYTADFAHFAAWCADVGVPALPASPDAVCLYVTGLVADNDAAGYSVATVERRLAAITYVHEVNGHGVSPARHVKVRELMAGVRRTYGRFPDKRDPLGTTQLAAMVAALDLGTLAAKRDRAVLLVGYAGAFHRSELAGLTMAQLARRGDGYIVGLGWTETDPKAKRLVGIPAFPLSPLCPVAALDAWLGAAGINVGPLFRKVTRYQTVSPTALSPASVALIVKRCATAAGIASSRLAAHSLRAGHATTAAANGAPHRAIMRQTGHRPVDTLEGHIRPGDVLRDSSARYLDLETS